MLQSLVKKDVDSFLEVLLHGVSMPRTKQSFQTHMAKELKHEGQKLRQMEAANKRLLEKMKEASKGRWTFSKSDKVLRFHFRPCHDEGFRISYFIPSPV
eukprot:751413-Hanusia_phi.AAC.2